MESLFPFKKDVRLAEKEIDVTAVGSAVNVNNKFNIISEGFFIC